MRLTLADAPTFWDTVGRALSLDERIFVAVQTSPHGLRVALTVVLLAGLSEALGQCVVLFAARVKPRRFVASLLLSASLYGFSFLFLSASIWLVGTQVFGRSVAFETILRTVGLGYAPYLFSFFVLTPYFGNPIGLSLGVWSLLAILEAVRGALDLTLAQAFACTALGWLLLQVVQRTVGRPIIAGARLLRRRIAGAPLATSKRELRELFELPQNPYSTRSRAARAPRRRKRRL
ncbi:hypothetical protein [Truepera radiovictrix]|uniref:Yip1 domain-containing protein n=1 Tax=Truepera radiovictrix (strain DSM 17093 / CIP 108686 / LMG 22925 / RQ-24) TaxID=649638 RepID=D7CSC0_TRURR|nr:hypothetical protein [Truepera radiovictrix]ADI13652.1 hypothetical protein Trad_0515 [Truepera radiovictrix DSM 17093]WMT57786.1 hypothetical protein RCV51_02280 [Truepera radiovictrix]